MDYDFNEDGITHINVYSKGKTEVGKWLSNFTKHPIDVPKYGKFDSIEGFWYWLQVRDDRLRNLSGFAAKKLGRELKDIDYREVKKFKKKIKSAVKVKLKTHNGMLDDYLNNPLPLVHYYLYGDKVIHNGKSDWLMNYIEKQIKKYVKFKRIETRS